MAETPQRSIFTDPNLRRMIAMVRAHPRPLAAALFGMVIAALTDPAIAALTRILLDQGFYARQAVAGLWVPLAFVGVFLVRGLATYASSYKISSVSQAVLVELRRRMFDRLLRWPQTTIENTPSGMVISKFINEASNALNLAAEVMTTAVRDSLSVVALLAVLLFYNWPLTLLTIAFAPLVGGILRVFSARLRRLNVENQLMLGELTRAVQEAHEGSRVIKIYDGAGYETERLDRINNRLRRFAMKMQVAWSAATPATQLIAAIGLAVVISLALWQARLGRLSGGEFIMFLTSALLLLQPLRHLSALNGPIARMSAAADSVFEMIDSPQEADEGTLQIERARGAIEFQRVSFQYPGTSAIALQAVDLVVAPGETIALVGPSGAGKTTLINLIPRFIRPGSGHILIDGMEIGQLRLASLRRQIALVSQDVVLFDDTITANIAYGACRGASMADVRAAAEAAFLMPLVDSLPNGFDTRIGENAVKLSGGQRQRLSIARALLKDAPVLLLDEATSALDSESERFIQISLERLMRGRTTFVVAHRLSTIEHADRIVVLDGGRVVEIGRHADLLATSGLYASLYRIQFAKTDHAVAA
ncbi:MAG TPA: lipid A export permease/ATP-binding protein MsbA [Burkholderiaceae bacterium]|nr:lipid A export permease/ATP-binding protein MsbA [Burkholderiaceae bacterium]